eukprot:CAMPEP_0182416342 /NCGR_PEP_ID=MMETSP1167-20130531/612_1 /TAXON_ID=2988 /ORGANISM="Mallomonas Sp, Strain CCMP3275" /LENGTH=147 /DNA_ID=CAMNT_0024589015 /DNA_START=166 /DNA_END=609 /DNA_ORIENTATION=+
MSFDLDKAVDTLSRNKILTKTAELGLLTKLEKAGFTLTSAAPLLVIADKFDALGYLEASSDKILPLAAKAIDLAPGLLPLAGTALKTPSSTFYGAAAAALAAAAGAVLLIPDDSVVNIALQTALVVPLGVIAPVGLGIGGTIISKLE